MPEVRDLDVLRPERRIVKLAGNEIDVSFIPVGLTFDIDDVTRDMATLDMAKIKAGDREETRKAFDMTVRLCAVFCQWKHPEMTEEWFRDSVSVDQLNQLGTEIRAALNRAYEGIDSKN